MIEIGTLVKWSDGSMGIVTVIHSPYEYGNSSPTYRVKWFDGTSGHLSAWQFKVVA